MSKPSKGVFEPFITRMLPRLPIHLRRAADGCGYLVHWAERLRCNVLIDEDDETTLRSFCELAFVSWHNVYFNLAAVSTVVAEVAGELAQFGRVSFGPIHAESSHHAALEFSRLIIGRWSQFADCSRWVELKRQSSRSERAELADIYRRIGRGDIESFKKARTSLSTLPPDLAGEILAAVKSEAL